MSCSAYNSPVFILAALARPLLALLGLGAIIALAMCVFA